jgi:hypothetical protein
MQALFFSLMMLWSVLPANADTKPAMQPPIVIVTTPEPNDAVSPH